MNEAEFLAAYDARAFAAPLVSVDGVLFTYHEECLQVLLVRRSNHPDLGKWGLPGGFIDLEADATLEDTVLRKLRDKTGVVPPYVHQVGTIGSAVRDKRGWSVTVCYTALIAHQACTAGLAVSDARWWILDEALAADLAFDHHDIIVTARERLRQKALYSIVPAYALPDKFTLPELQHLHELLIGRPLQKKSFRRRIEQAGLLEELPEKRADGGRPATLYRLKDTAQDFTFIRNIGEQGGVED